MMERELNCCLDCTDVERGNTESERERHRGTGLRGVRSFLGGTSGERGNYRGINVRARGRLIPSEKREGAQNPSFKSTRGEKKNERERERGKVGGREEKREPFTKYEDG